jgi:acyl-CoA synthetase (AMP-forming)/AMP-acid ligase II
VNLAALLFDVARRQGEAPAVSDGVHAWSYRSFVHRISSLAGSLRAYGLESGERVMLCMDNCAEFLEMMFACWTAGLCTVPVNARLHVREIEHIARIPAHVCWLPRRAWRTRSRRLHNRSKGCRR